MTILCLLDLYKQDGRSKLLDLNSSTVTEMVKACYCYVILSVKVQNMQSYAAEYSPWA